MFAPKSRSLLTMIGSRARVHTFKNVFAAPACSRNFFGFNNNNNNTGSSWEQKSQQTPQQEQQAETKKPEQTQQQEQQQTQQQTESKPAVDDARVKELEKEIENLKNSNAKYDDQLKRAVAEMANVRRIAKNDVDNAKKFALQSFSKNLLDVVDNLEAGLKHLIEEDVSQIVKLAQNNPECSEEMRKKANALFTSIEGVKRTENVLLKVLERNGVTKMEVAEKTPFDPNFHEAMMKVPPSEKTPHNTVAMVLKSGWILNERVLRPAQVIVAIQD